MKLLTLILMLALGACAHHESPKHNEQIAQVITETSKHHDKSQKNDEYLKNYQQYLESVAAIYEESGIGEKFNDYLAGLMNNSRELEKMEATVAERYSAEKRKPANAESRGYQLYRTKVMTEFHDELNEARMNKLKGELDQETFEKLLANKEKFTQTDANGDPMFLYPL